MPVQLEDLSRPFYPSDHILCILSSKSYDNDPLQLPDGWRLLKKEENRYDGYFGAAFFNDAYKQLVIAHRGTSENWLTDLNAVVKNNYTSQFYSACTFALLIVKNYHEQCYSISITGHSLGGWLAQSTAFAIQYLKIENEQNYRRYEVTERKFHPHTVVFGSPGGFDILRKLSNDYFHRYKNFADHLISDLDITTYLTEPNLINVTNEHVGRLIICNSKPDLQIWEKLMPHSYISNKLDNFLHAFENNVPKSTVLDWPKFGRGGIWNIIINNFSLSSSEEYDKFFEEDIKANNYDPFSNYLNKEKKINVHYKIRDIVENVANINVFTENERIFLENWKMLEVQLEEGVNPDVLNKLLDGLGSFENFLPDFKILKNKQIECKGKDELNEIVNRVKWLFAYFPNASHVMKEQISKIQEAYKCMYEKAMNGYLLNLPRYKIKDNVGFFASIKFKDNFGLEEFLRSEDFYVRVIKTENTKDEAYRINSILQKSKYSNKFCIFSFSDLMELDKHVDVFSVFSSSSTIDGILVIDFGDKRNLEIVGQFIKIANEVKKKIICIVAENIENTSLLQHTQIQERKEITLNDLDDDILKHNFFSHKLLSLSGQQLALKDFLKNQNLEAISNTIPFQAVKKFFLNSNEIIEVRLQNDHYNQVFFNLTTTTVSAQKLEISSLKDLLRKYESTLESIIEKSFEEIMFLVTGVNDDEFMWNKLGKSYDQIILNSSIDLDKTSTLFQNFCLNNPKKIIFRLHMSDSTNDFKWIDTFNPDLYMERNFVADKVEMNEEELLKKFEKIILISSDAGMGKSTTLLNLARKNRKSWKIWINLQDAHKNINSSSTCLDSVIDFLLKFTNNYSQLAKILLRFSLTIRNSVPVSLFFDAFNEIQDDESNAKRNVKTKILEIIKLLKNETFAKIFISTRPYDCEIIQKETNATPIHLKPFSEENRIQFCKLFWLSRLCLTNYKNSEINEKLNSKAQRLIGNVNHESNRDAFGIPLLLRMFNEIFQPDNLNNIVQEKFHFNLHELYSKFQDKKYETLFNSKMCFTPVEKAEKVSNAFKAEHKNLGLNLLFPVFKLSINFKKLNDLNGVGLVQIKDSTVNFVHETFAEYFAAELLMDRLENPSDKYVQYVMVSNVLKTDRCTVIRRFINDMLAKKKDKKSSEILKFISLIWPKVKNCSICPKYHYFAVDSCKYMILQKLVNENNSKLLQLILETLNRSDESLKNDLLNARGDPITESHGNTSLYSAIENHNVEIAEILSNYNPNVHIRGKLNDTCFHLSAKYPIFNDFTMKILQKEKVEAIFKIHTNERDLWDIAFEYGNWDLLIKIYNLYNSYSVFKKEWLVDIMYIAAESDDELALKLLNEVEYDDLTTKSFRGYGRWNLIKMIIDLKKHTDPYKIKDAEYAQELIRSKENIWDKVMENNINFKDEKYQKYQTFLHFAVSQKRFHAAENLIKKGANINYWDTDKNSPAYLAALTGHWDLVLTFMDKLESENSEPLGRKLLHLACEQNHCEAVIKLATTGRRDLNARDASGRTPLLIAANKRHWTLLSQLIEQQHLIINTNFLPYREEIFHILCKSNKIKLAVQLICKIAEVNSTVPTDNWAPLIDSATMSDWGLVSEFIKLGASVSVKNQLDQTILHFACRDNQTDLVLDLLNNHQFNQNSTDTYGNTPLLFAAEKGHWDLVLTLLKFKPVSKQHGQMLLYYACRDNEFNLVKQLIKDGAQMNVAHKPNDIPLIVAAKKGHWNLISAVLKLNSFLTILDKERLLHIACEENKIDLVLELIKNGVDINSRNDLQETPLLTAAFKGHWDLVSELIKSKVDVTVSNTNNLSLLHLACRDGISYLVSDLLKNKQLCVNAIDKKSNRTPILYAAQNGQWDLVNKLIELGADCKIPDLYTILYYACKDNQAILAITLLREVRDLHSASEKIKTLFYAALDNGHLELIDKISKETGLTFWS